MSSMCVCHIEGEWCFYCVMYSPLEDRYREAQTEIARLQAFIQHESEGAIDAVQELERLRLARDYWKAEFAAEEDKRCLIEMSADRLALENDRLRSALEQIAGATMSQYASVDDVARGIKRIAKEALSNGEKSTQEDNGR